MTGAFLSTSASLRVVPLRVVTSFTLIGFCVTLSWSGLGRAQECEEYAFYFGARATEERHIVEGREFVISSRNAEPVLGFQCGVREVTAGNTTTWTISDTLGGSSDTLVKAVLVDLHGERLTPETPNEATSVPSKVLDITRGAAIREFAAGDFLGFDINPPLGGPGFTVGYVSDLDDVANAIPPTPQGDACPLNELIVVSIEPVEQPFYRGDCNSSGAWGEWAPPVDLADAAAVMSYLLAAGEDHFDPTCLDACDCDDDGRVDPADAICILQYLFQGGRVPPSPGPGLDFETWQFYPPGPDPTPDDLSCAGAGQAPQRHVCENGVDDDGDGLIDGLDPACHGVFACGSRELDEEGRPGPLEGYPGSTVELSFYLQTPGGDAADEESLGDIQGFSMALSFHCALTSQEEFDISGTILESLEAEYVAVHVDNDPRDGDGCELVIAVLVDAEAPHEGKGLPSQEAPHRVGSMDFTIPETTDGGVYSIVFEDGLGGRGRVPVVNRLVSASRSFSPVLTHPCEVRVRPGFFRGDCNYSRRESGASPVDIADVTAVMSYVFVAGPERYVPRCLDACDFNDDGEVTAADAVDILKFYFELGDFPPAPGPGLERTGGTGPKAVKATPPGADPTPDALDCEGDRAPVAAGRGGKDEEGGFPRGGEQLRVLPGLQGDWADRNQNYRRIVGQGGGQAEFIRGDYNQTGTVSVGDVVALVDLLFYDATERSCLNAGDATGDGVVDIKDAAYIASYVLAGGAPPPPPFPDPGLDPTEPQDSPSCASYSAVPAAVDETVIFKLSDVELPRHAGARGFATLTLSSPAPVDAFTVGVLQEPSGRLQFRDVVPLSSLRTAEVIQTRREVEWVALGVLMDWTPPNGRQRIPAGEDIPIAELEFELLRDCPDAGPLVTLKLGVADLVEGGPIQDLVVVKDGIEVVPATEDGEVSILDVPCVEPPELCSNGVDDDRDGRTDLEDPDCAPRFACGSRDLDENGLPGPIQAELGSETEVSFFLKAPTGGLQGLSLAATFCCELVANDTLDTSGTIFDAIGVDYVRIQVDNDPNDGDGCELVIGVLADALEPFTSSTIPPLLQFERIGSMAFTVGDTAELASSCAVTFMDAINGQGVVPVRNVVVVDNTSVTPELEDCQVLPPGILVGGFDFIRGGEGASFAEGAAFEEARLALQDRFPRAGFRSTARITREFLDPLELFVLPTASNDADGILPLSESEKSALFHWVASGGSLLVLGDSAENAGSTFGGILERFGMAAGLTIGGECEAAARPIHTITRGVDSFKQHDAGWMSRPGDATVLAWCDGVAVLAVLKPGELRQKPNPANCDSGPVVFFSDTNVFWTNSEPGYRGFFPENEALFLNAIEYLLDHDPEPAKAPRICTVDVPDSPSGTPVTIFGDLFGSPGTVTFDGTEAEIISWSTKTVVAEKPDSRTDGAIQLITAGGIPSNVHLYSVCGLEPLRVDIVKPALPPDDEPVRTQVGEAVFFEGQGWTDSSCYIEIFLWNLGDEPTLHEGERVVHRYERPGTYTVCFICGDRCPDETLCRGRTVSTCIPVEVIPRPMSTDIVIEPPNPARCDALTLIGQVADDNPPPRTHTFCWRLERIEGDNRVPIDLGEQDLCSRTTPQVLLLAPEALQPGEYEAFLEVCNDFGACASDSERFTVRENDSPQVSIRRVAPPMPLAGLPVTFESLYTDRCGGGPYACRWNFGDGTPEEVVPDCPEVSQLAHIFASCGDYTVRLEVTDGLGATGFAILPVRVEVAPTAAFTVPPSPRECEELIFDPSPSSDPCFGIVAYIWDFGDGSPPVRKTSDEPVNHTYSESGNYAVALRVEDGAGLSDTTSQAITVANVPPVVADIVAGQLCLGESSSLCAVARDCSPGDQEALTYEWTLSCGDVVSSKGPCVTVFFPDPCEVVVRCQARDPDGGESEIYLERFEILAPIVNAVATCESPVFSGQAAIFSAVHSTANTCALVDYRWDFGDGTTGTGITARHAFCEVGDYTITLTAEDCCGNTGTATCNVAVRPSEVTAEIGCPPGPILEGQEVTFSASGSSSNGADITVYRWELGNGDLALGKVAKTAYCQDGEYTVKLTVFDRCGVSGTSTCTVTVLNAPPVCRIDFPSKTCPGEATLRGNCYDPGCDDLTCTWVLPDGSERDACEAFYTFLQEDVGQTFQVTLVCADDDTTCSVTQEIEVVDECEPPEAECGLCGPGKITEGDEVCFTGKGSTTRVGELVSYRWCFGDGTCTERLPIVDLNLFATHRYRDDGTYRATLTLWNSFGLSDSCTVDVNVLNAPPIVNAGPDQEVMVGTSVLLPGSFTDRGQDDTHGIHWDFGDGGESEELRARHVYAEEGVYPATLTVVDDDGGVGSDTAVIRVGPRPPLVAVRPASALVSTCLAATTLAVQVSNLRSEEDEIALAVEGLDPAWYELAQESVVLLPGATTRVPLRVNPGSCAGNEGGYPFTATGTSATSGLVGTGHGSITVLNSPIIREATVSPPDGALLSSTTVNFSWETVAPSTASLFLRRADEGDFTRFEGPPEEVTRHRLTVRGLESGIRYIWYGESTCCAGEAYAATRERTFLIERGVAIDILPVECLKPSFGQPLEVVLTNLDDAGGAVQTVSLSIPTVPEGIGSLFLEETEVTLEPTETRTVRLLVDARGATSGEVYSVQVQGVLRRSGRATEASEAVLICDPDIRFTFEELQDERNEIEAINTFLLVNDGVPLTSTDNGLIVIERGEGFDPGELIFLDGRKFALDTGEEMRVRVQYVDCTRGNREGTLVATARHVSVPAFTDFGCPGETTCQSVTVQDLTLCRRVDDWYSNRMDGDQLVIPFEVPAGFSREDIDFRQGRAPLVAIRFELREEGITPEVIPNHSIQLEFNGHALAPAIRNTAPLGDWAFRLEPELLLLPGGSGALARNDLVLRVTDPGDRPFLVNLDARLVVPLKESTLRLCAPTPEDAHRYLEEEFEPDSCDLDVFDLGPKITEVAIVDAATHEEEDLFCLAETRTAEIQVKIYNSSGNSPDTELSYEIAQVVEDVFLQEVAGSLASAPLDPFSIFVQSWPWEIPLTDERGSYGVGLWLLEPAGAPPENCYDCPGFRWFLRADRASFDLSHRPEELFVGIGQTNRLTLCVESICGFEGDVELEVESAPPLIETSIVPPVVPAGECATLAVSVDPRTIPGKHFITVKGTAEGRSNRFTLPLTVTERKGSDLVIRGRDIEAQTPGFPRGLVIAGEETELTVTILNAGDTIYLGAEELVFFRNFDGLGRFVQHDLIPLELPNLAPGGSYTFTVTQVFPRQFGVVSFCLLKDEPSFFGDNYIDHESNCGERGLDVHENPIPYLSCAANLIGLVWSSSWTQEVRDALSVPTAIYPPIKELWRQAELQDALRRKDTDAVSRIVEKSIFDFGKLYLKEADPETYNTFLSKVFAGLGVLQNCPEACKGFFRGQIDTWQALFDMAKHVALRGFIEEDEDTWIVHAHSPVDLILEDAQGRRTFILHEGAEVREIPGSIAARAGAGKFVIVSGSEPPEILLEGVEDGSCQIAVYWTRRETEEDLYAIFPQFEVMPGLVAEILVTDGTGLGRLDIDRDANGTVDEALTPEVSKVRQLDAPVLLPGFLGPMGPEGEFNQTVHTARFLKAEQLEFSLLKGPKDMTLDPVTGDIRWVHGLDDAGEHEVEVEVAQAIGEEVVRDRATYRLRLARLEGLNVVPDAIQAHDCGLTTRLRVTGHYEDGSTVDLTSLSSGTTYESADLNIAEVTAAGVVNVHGAGRTTITVRNREISVVAVVEVESSLGVFKRGDCNRSGRVDLTDAINILEYLLTGRFEPRCFDACDVDDSGRIDTSDPILCLMFLFAGGVQIPPPFADCGCDPSPDELDCELSYCPNFRPGRSRADGTSEPPPVAAAAGATEVRWR